MEEKSWFESFLGTGWTFPPTFSRQAGGLELVSNEEDIAQSLEVLLSTHLGERMMEPEYGCDLSKLMFETLTLSFKVYMKDLIQTAILNHEPRITLNNLELDLQQDESGIIRIALDYTIKGTNSRYNYVYPYYIGEGVNVQ